MDSPPVAPSAAIDADAEFERLDLGGGSWIDIARGWITGANDVYRYLESTVSWRQGRVFRYDKYMETPSLHAPGSMRDPHHPVLVDAERALRARYHVQFDGFGLAYYRNARDSVAMHRDREMRWLDDTVVAIVTFGARRPFLVQPLSAHDRSQARDLAPASGDLMVFGGRIQAEWLHGVPKVSHAVRGRISAQWRYTSKRGRPEMTPTFYAPRNYSKGSRVR